MDALDFINDAELRKTIEGSIEFTYALLEESKRKRNSRLYQRETYRVIVLYAVSVIEAVLLFLYKKSGEEMTFADYKFVQKLPPEFRRVGSEASAVVVAVQKIQNKAEHQIGIKELTEFFKKKGWMAKEMDRLLPINDLRNTFHLFKPRGERTCSIRQVEASLKLLVDVIERGAKIGS